MLRCKQKSLILDTAADKKLNTAADKDMNRYKEQNIKADRKFNAVANEVVYTNNG